MEIYQPVRPAKKLIEGFRGLATSTIGNALDDLKISGVIQNIKPVCPGFRFAGGALTVKEDPAHFQYFTAIVYARAYC